MRGEADGRTGATRAQALGAAAAGGAIAMAAGWLRPASTAGKPSHALDVRILNFLLVLEEAQAGFYDAALHAGKLHGKLLQYAQVVAPQEHAHVAFLRKLLGSEAKAKPALDFGEVTGDPKRFQQTAIDLEEATAAGYIGQGGNLTRGVVGDAARIVAVEARHAAWIRDLAGADPAPRAADPARSAQDIIGELKQKGFLR
jgi:Ferritin-like domain